jgi:hypothetical protein
LLVCFVVVVHFLHFLIAVVSDPFHYSEKYEWNEEFQKIMEELHRTPNESSIYERLSKLGNDFLYAAKVNLSFSSELKMNLMRE